MPKKMYVLIHVNGQIAEYDGTYSGMSFKTKEIHGGTLVYSQEKFANEAYQEARKAGVNMGGVMIRERIIQTLKGE